METSAGDADRFLRHIAACRNARLPGGRARFLVGDTPVGWVAPPAVAVLRESPWIEANGDGVRLIRPESLEPLGRRLAQRGLCRWRGELFDVRANANAPVLGRVDRGALPVLGIEALGVHVNGLVERADGPHLWIARRAANKALDPGKLDHIVAGGVPAGLTPEETLVKEAAEEAAIPADLARRAVRVGTIAYAMERPEGLRRDVLYCYDLILPEDFGPHAVDGEVESFALWPLPRVLAAVRDTDEFKFNVNLVLTDLFLRRGLIAGSDATVLRAALDASSPSKELPHRHSSSSG